MAKQIYYPDIPESFAHKIYVKLCWYTKHGESLVGEESIECITLNDLQNIFNVYIDNAHLNYWHVKTRHARAIQRLTRHQILINKFIYFIEQKSFFNISPLKLQHK
jgi:hypothetical protein